MASVPQNPSPMQEHTRAHERIKERTWPGVQSTVDGILPRPVELYMSPANASALWVHFHGTPFVAHYAAARAKSPLSLACVQLGAGSAAYERPFAEPGAFARLLSALRAAAGSATGLWLSSFSAGYGALRAILGEEALAEQVDVVLILDGLHSGYRPEGCPLAAGGVIEAGQLEPFVRFARRAMAGEVRMLITHSEVFPGTFASTTETADYLLDALGLSRRAVLEWGPLGMQQLSETGIGRLRIMGFAGNSAPDHTDHLHGLYHFVDEWFAL